MSLLYILFWVFTPLWLFLLYIIALIIIGYVRYQFAKGAFKDIPVVPIKPRFGTSSLTVKDFYPLFAKSLVETYPKGLPPLLFGGPSLSGRPILWVTDPSGVRAVADDLVYPKSYVFDMIGIFLGNGLVVSKGEYWESQRNLINPWFHASKLRNMASTMVKDGIELVQSIKAHKGGPVDVLEVMGKTTQKVLIDSMLSGKLDSEWVHEAWSEANLALGLFLFGGMVFGPTVGSWRVWPWTRKVIANRQKLREKVQVLIDEAVAKGGDAEGDFIEYMVANGSSPDTIFEEVLTVLFAGHDTTKNSMGWLMYFLALNPAILQKLQQEVDTELKGAEPTVADINKLRNCRNAFMESLRLRPPAPSIGRACPQNVTLCGQKIPADTVVMMYFQGPMVDPKYWPDPLTFNPDRFDEDPQYTHHYMPFSTGRRNCIGQKFAIQEGTIFAAQLVQNFDIVLCTEYPVVAKFEGTMVPKGLHCKFIERKK